MSRLENEEALSVDRGAQLDEVKQNLTWSLSGEHQRVEIAYGMSTPTFFFVFTKIRYTADHGGRAV